MDLIRGSEAGFVRRVSACNRMLAGCVRALKRRWLQTWPLGTLIVLVLGTATLEGRKIGNNLPNGPTQAAEHGAKPDTTLQPFTTLHSPVKLAPSARAKVSQAYARLPLSFEANQGQAPSDVKYISHGSEYSLFLTTDSAVLELHPALGSLQRRLSKPRHLPSLLPLESLTHERRDESSLVGEQSPALLGLKLMGVNGSSRPKGFGALPGKSSYFIGSDPAGWHANVGNYARVSYSELYPGVDLVYYGNQRRLEYDFIVAPGADLKQIAWEFERVSNFTPETTIDSQGNLLVSVGNRMVRFDKPAAYEFSANDAGLTRRSRHYLDARYMVRDNGQFGFAVANHDATKTLVIDPVVVLQYSSYLGGGADDLGLGIAVDSSGNAFVTGQTLSANFPTTLGTIQAACASCNLATPAPDVFVTKFNSTGSNLIYSTYLGGNATDVGFGIAVDPAGNAYVTGKTLSTDFPTTLAFQTACSSCVSGFPDAFVAKLNPTGSTLLFSTYLGGSKSDQGLAIAADSSGAYVTGSTSSSDFFMMNPLPAPNNALQGSQNAFVAKFDPSGVLLSSTYLGGSNADTGFGIAADSSGIYVAGQTSSNNFPTLNPYQSTFKGVTDAFISKLSPNGSSLIYSTYLGGALTDGAAAIAVDSSGNAYVTGSTNSTDFPLTPGAFQTAYGGGGSDAFVAKLNAKGSLVYSTYLGGSDIDVGNGIAVDASGNANIVGQTASTNFPTANPVQPAYNLNTDAFVSRLVPTGCAPTLSTYLGGSSVDVGSGIAVDSVGNAYVTGQTSSNNFPVQNPFQPATGGGFDGFLTRLNIFSAPALCLSLNTLTFPGQSLTTTSAGQTVTVINGGNVTLNITGVTASGNFGQTNTCLTSSPIAAGANCAIDVTFAPTVAARNTGAVSITDDAGGSPHSIALAGVGTDFNVSVSPPTATVAAGHPTTFTLTVAPLSGFNSTVALTCSGLPLNSSCSFSSNSVTLDGSTAAMSTVTVSTAARSGLVQFRNPGIVDPGSGWKVFLFLLLGLAILFALAHAWGSLNDFKTVNYMRLAGLVGLLLAAMVLSSCGFNSNPPSPSGTPAGNYPLAFTGTDGTLQHTLRVTLTVN